MRPQRIALVRYAAWLVLVACLTASSPLAASTGYCPTPYCGTGRPDPWPGDVPLPNEQLAAAYLTRYGQPPGSGGSRAGYCCELFGVNYTILEGMCRAGQIPAAAFSEPSSPTTFAARLRASIAEVQALPAAYLDGLRALDQDAAAGKVDESTYARRRSALQGLVPHSKSTGHNCLATTTEATDASFAIGRGSPTACQWWLLTVWPTPPPPVVRKDKPPGVFSEKHPQHGCMVPWTNTCGDHAVQAGEDATTCPADVAPPAPRCGDSHADPGETCSSCPADLGPCPPPPPRCGDGHVDAGETCVICPADAGACPPPPPPVTALALGAGSRFKVEAAWRTPIGTTGIGHPRPLVADTGAFWFFSPTNLELLVKVLDGCAASSHYWVFAGGLTNVEVTLTVTDTSTGAARVYTNPQGVACAPIQDTAAFPCP